MNSSARSILSLSWQSLAYGIGLIGSQIIVYFMLPILTHYMPRADYGAVSVITSLYAFLNTLTNAGLPSATFRYYNEDPSEENHRLTLGASQFLFFLFAAVPAAAIVIFARPISSLLLGSGQYALALQLAAGFLIADSLNFFGTIILRIQVRPLVASLQGMILVLCETGMAVLFVVVYHLSVAGYWLGFLVGEIIGLTFTFFLVRKALVFRIRWSNLRDLIKFGVPLIPTELSMTALRLADRYIIGAIIGLGQVAVYDVGYKLGSLINLAITPFRTAWLPFALSMTDKPDARKVYRDVLTYLIAACLFLVLGVTAFRHTLVGLVAPASYMDATRVIVWVAGAQLFQAIYIVRSVAILITKRTSQLAWSAVSAGCLNLLLNVLLIPRMGILGAAVSTFVSYLVLAVLTYFIGQRSYPVPVDWARLGKLVVAGGAVAIGLLAVERFSGQTLMALGLKAIALACYPILLLAIGVVTPGQARALWARGAQTLGKRLQPGQKQA